VGVAVRRELEGRVMTGLAGCWGVWGGRRDVWSLIRMAEAEGKREYVVPSTVIGEEPGARVWLLMM